MSGHLLKELKDNDLIVEDPENKALQLVRHVFKNLLEGAVQDDGNHLKPYLKDKIAPLAPIAILSTTTSPTTTSTTAKSTTAFEAKYKDVSRFGKRPFRVHVSKDKGQQAFADGFRNIVIEQNLIQEVGYDEDMVAAVLAHELAHAMQDHVHEQASFQTAVFNTGSDLLSLEILARSGYDPISAARVQKFFVESEEKLLLAKFVRCTTLTQKKVFIDGDGGKRSDGGVGRGKKKGKGEMDPVERQDELLKRYGERRWWKGTHPEGRDRVEYLLKAIYPMAKMMPHFWL
ncbi:hypothetical protein BGZ97_004519 [Linnemannia gamsii]|uniref:Peptidase M48 domain-containing protein n=1 Tax=Linnemannia gamsii TaxID=64522 RepID=A0A9P6QU95_9FUNG|nr:hypothetical protein BGZ97_004519 [Linnemannia gamsii]